MVSGILRMVMIKNFIFPFFLLILSLVLLSQATVGSPAVVFASPKGSDVPVDAVIEVTFNEKMSQEETEQGFIISPLVDDGEFTWVDKNLTFKPNSPLDYGTKYSITISTEVRNLVGESFTENYSWDFTTENDNVVDNGKDSDGEKKNDWWEEWEPIITGGTIAGTGIAALIGYSRIRKKRSQLKRYIDRLDVVYSKYRHDPKICEMRLISLKDSLKKKVKQGEVDEYHYLILDKKIDDYLEEMKSKYSSSKPKIVKIIEDEKKPEEKAHSVKEIEDKIKKEMKKMKYKEEKELKSKKVSNDSSKKPPGPKIIGD